MDERDEKLKELRDRARKRMRIRDVVRYLERYYEAPEHTDISSHISYSAAPMIAPEPTEYAQDDFLVCCCEEPLYADDEHDVFPKKSADEVLAEYDEDFVYLEPKHKAMPMASCSMPPPRIPRGRMQRRDGILSSATLDGMLDNMDKGFADTLFYYINKVGITDVEAYKRSNVDKKTFSKIKCNPDYRPSKITAVSFAIGLRLDIDETTHLLSTAGMCLSRSSKFDVIIAYFVTSGKYDSIFDVNEVLYQFDQSLLGVQM